jgi:hypothetical protein
VIAFGNHPSKAVIKQLGHSKSGSNNNGAGQSDFGPGPDVTIFSRFSLIKSPNAIALEFGGLSA